MNVLITGGTGFVGKYLQKELLKNGHEVVVVTRNTKKYQMRRDVKFVAWNPLMEPTPQEAFTTISGNPIDVVINLLGENISAARWSDDQKDKIYNSRILGTRNLVRGIEQHLKNDLDLFISTSAVGIYEANLPDELEESSIHGKGFLSRVCEDWETEANKLTKAKRTLITRVGVVFGSTGGALEKLLPVFKLGGGGPIGNGKQIMSWIHVKDLVNIYIQAIGNENYKGIVNAVSPEVTTNKEFTKALAQAVGRPALFPVPPQMLKLIFGEMSSIILDSQNIKAKALSDLGHEFLYSNVFDALSEIGQGVNFIGKPVTA
tara:strand:- start:7058 stop:8011 length:954 start_codon:yes stop_codon:yes gene_type:complete